MAFHVSSQRVTRGDGALEVFDRLAPWPSDPIELATLVVVGQPLVGIGATDSAVIRLA